MKKQYIMQVKKALAIPTAKKKEVIRDLEEVFASAQEHGETEQAVILRLGSPQEFARNTQEQLGEVGLDRQRQKNLYAIVGCCLGAILCFGFFLYIQLHKMPEHVIGQANTMTTIQVRSSLPFEIWWIPVIFGGLFALLLVFFTIKYRQEKHDK